MTGHQKNDQAENFIIRADHGSGVYGLSGIASISKINGVKVVRPLLNFTKQELQDFLKAKKIKWIEDPSNQNDLFTRVRVRKFLNQYPDWIEKLANVSKNLSKTKDAIEYMVNKSMSEIVDNSEQGVLIKLEAFNMLPQEIRFRMLSRILQNVSGEAKPARAERIENLINKIEKGLLFKASTLSKCIGCLFPTLI
jgi:tRNA(Ile)-lysidine synthase